jgi:AcrR family transcriptional regulator
MPKPRAGEKGRSARAGRASGKSSRASRARRAASPAADGRALRSERSREAIAVALYELIGEGNLVVSAQRVADRAGVGIRTVFRHFSDMETLFATLDARLLEGALPLLEGEPLAGDLTERAHAMLAKRIAFFERITPYKRAGNLRRWRSPYLSGRHTELVGRLREELLRWIPELERAPAACLEALDQASSFEAWDRLRGEQRLGRARAAAAMEYAVLALVGTLER